jgi:hypothetical protein
MLTSDKRQVKRIHTTEWLSIAPRIRGMDGPQRSVSITPIFLLITKQNKIIFYLQIGIRRQAKGQLPGDRRFANAALARQNQNFVLYALQALSNQRNRFSLKEYAQNITRTWIDGFWRSCAYLLIRASGTGRRLPRLFTARPWAVCAIR